MNHLGLAIRLLVRDFRSGELSILLIALSIAVTSTSTISLFADRLHSTMNRQAAEFLAADLVVSGSGIAPDVWHQEAFALQLNEAQTVEFSTVLMENEQTLLAGVKAVSDAYPLRGRLKTIQNDYTIESIANHAPSKDTVWVEKRVLSALGLKLGDSLSVGEKSLKIERVLTYEPDKRGDLYSLSPRVMMHIANLAETQVIQPGSHAHYFYQFAGEAQAIAQFKTWVKPRLNPSQRLMDIYEDRPEVGGALKRAERYLGLSSIMVVLIAGVAIAMSTQRYTERHFDTAAILRCLGSTQAQIVNLFSYQILIIGIIASLLGCLLGWIGQGLLLNLLSNLLPVEILPASFLSLCFGFIIGMVILIGFALPPLLRLRQVPALRVLRRDLEPLPKSAVLVYGLASGIISLLIGRYTQDLRLTLTIVVSLIATLFVLGLIILSLLKLIRFKLRSFNLTWRLGLQNLTQLNLTSTTQILAFSITLMAMIICFSVKSDLVDSWKTQLSERAPNHFALNIFPEQVASVKQNLRALTQTNSQFFPVVSGRLIRINDAPVRQHVTKDSQGEQAIERDLSLTWSMDLPLTNSITSGAWWNSDIPNVVSVEQKLAENLHINLNDTLTFSVGSEQFQAQVKSLRKVPWETMQPNFYMIFSPATLEKYPHTFITSFFLEGNQKHELNNFLKQFPNTMILEVDVILNQFKTILNQLTSALNYLFYLALGAGITVLFAAVYSTLDQRIFKGAVMRTLGAKRSILSKSHLIEFGMLGGISGVMSIVLAELIMATLYHFVLHLEYQINFLLWIVIPLSSALIIGLTGLWGLRNVVKKPPLQILLKS